MAAHYPKPGIAVLGASGLIGQAIAAWLIKDGFRVVAVARRFTEAQKFAFAPSAVEMPLLSQNADRLAQFLTLQGVEIVVNCLGVLQDGQGATTDEIHHRFVTRLIEAIDAQAEPALLIHLSIPGRDDEDVTPFSRSKRAAEHAIAASGVPFVILRPGFVVAPAAYGGSALMRALGALPIALPKNLLNRPFATVDVKDIARTVSAVAMRWAEGERIWAMRWDVMERQPGTFGDVVNAFRQHIGGSENGLALPPWLMTMGAKAGDLSAHLGWAPPIRTTALQELQRGVAGAPETWVAESGIEPSSLNATLRALGPSVQEKWFARLYLLKPLITGSLVLFWVLSGLIALTVSFDAATSILTAHGFSESAAQAIGLISSLADISVGIAIAFRKTCRPALIAGIALSLAYMAGAAILTPDLWLEPLGALVKTGPAIVLMLVNLAILDNR